MFFGTTADVRSWRKAAVRRIVTKQNRHALLFINSRAMIVRWI